MSEFERPDIGELTSTLGDDEAAVLLGAIRRESAESGCLQGLRSLPTPVRQALANTSIAGVLGSALLIGGVRDDWRALLLPIAGFAVAASLSLGFAFRPMWRPNPNPGRRLTIAASGLVLVAVASIVPELWPGVLPPVSARPSIDAGCATASFFDGGVVLLAFLLLDRHRGQRLFSAMAVGSTGALLAFAVQTLHCPAIHPGHLLVTHALAGALAGAFAYLLVRRAAARARE